MIGERREARLRALLPRMEGWGQLLAESVFEGALRLSVRSDR